jgi:CBS domain containing-hemolysin-like protein
MSGDVHVDEVERALGIELPRGDYETIAGLVIAHYGGLPPEGTTLEVELPPDPGRLAHDDVPTPRFLRIEVLEVDRHVPARVRLVLPDVADAARAAHTATDEEVSR